MGDPETQVVIPKIENDLLEIFDLLAKEKLNEVALKIDERFATTVVLASGGYPETYENGKEISGLNQENENSLVFHAGTKVENDKVVTSGGRVLAITGFGENMEQALKTAYERLGKIHFEKGYFRKDIGFDLK